MDSEITIKQRWQMWWVRLAGKLETIAYRIRERFDVCYLCDVEGYARQGLAQEGAHWCESCGRRMCYDHTSPDWDDCDICEACDKALEECGAKAECRIDESEVEA